MADLHRILLLGFEPFAEFPINPSWEAIRELDGQTRGDLHLSARRLPVSYAQAGAALAAHLREVSPALSLAFGVHRHRRLHLERVALNIDHTPPERPDNDGQAPQDRAIRPAAPMALSSRLPLDPLLSRLRQAGVPARLSFHAGTYLCNHIFYRLLDETGGPAAFVHLPPLRSQERWWGWPRERHDQAIETLLDAVAELP